MTGRWRYYHFIPFSSLVNLLYKDNRWRHFSFATEQVNNSIFLNGCKYQVPTVKCHVKSTLFCSRAIKIVAFFSTVDDPLIDIIVGIFYNLINAWLNKQIKMKQNHDN